MSERTFEEVADIPNIMANVTFSSGRRETPVPGVYTLARVKDRPISKYTFPYPKNGNPDQRHNHAGYNFTAEIIGGPAAGSYVKVGINTMVFRADEAMSIAQYIAATGIDLVISGQALLDDCSVRDNGFSLIDQVVGPFKAITTWEFSCRSCQEGTFLKGHRKPTVTKKFAGKETVALTDGNVSEEQTCPTCEQTVTAQHVVSKFIEPPKTASNGNGRGPVAG